MNNAPLLASLGVKGNPAPAGTPEATLGDALATDDRALDAALEFASLLLQSGETGKTLPDTGKLLPLAEGVVPEPGILEDAALIAQDVAVDEAVEQAVNNTIAASAKEAPASGQLGNQIAGDIRRAKAVASGSTLPVELADKPVELANKPVIVATTEPVKVPPPQVPMPNANMPPPAITPAKIDLDVMPKMTGAERSIALTPEVPTTTGPVLRNLAPLPAGLQEASALAPRSMSLDVPLGDQDWGRQFSERVGWVIHARVPNAQLRLNPEHLGPIEMSIEVDDQNARVQFVAAHALTRDAIEQSLPRLREMLEQQGLNLQQADVGAEGGAASDSGEQALADEAGPSQGEHASEQSDVTADGSKVVLNRSVGLIDTFV